ncbi:MAG: ABC transporter ATP-binding protein [Pseudomonadota bacterium]
MSAGSSRPAVEVRNVVKRFGTVTALKGATLDIQDNEFFTLLGPSGCGKTTLLRLIAGFEDITEGTILLFGEEIADLPPNRRPVNTVFQHYALFPHMTVAENVAFGMLRQKVPKAEAMERTMATLALVKLDQFAERRPSQLSGGQQQRVALARAMAPRPKVLLLDEPLSALDLKLRQAMRVELKQLQQETGITFVFVTHDQEEALTMSDRIAVMSEGELQQIGTAHDIYEKPDNRFVADFIGETNLIDVTITSAGTATGSSFTCRLPGGATIEAQGVGHHSTGESGHVSIRPERIAITRSEQVNGPRGVVEHVVYLGTDTQHLVRLDEGPLITVRTQNAHRGFVDLKPGDRTALTIDPGAARLLTD